MSEASAPMAASAERKPRSPAERAVVWGGILLLTVLAIVQARARIGYSVSLSRLQAQLAKDEGATPHPLLLADVERYLVGWPSKSVTQVMPHQDTVTYSWRGLTATYRITLPYDPTESAPAVLGLETGDAPQPDHGVPAAPAENTTAGAPR